MQKILGLLFTCMIIFILCFTFMGMGVNEDKEIDSYISNITNGVSTNKSYVTPESYKQVVEQTYGDDKNFVTKGADGKNVLNMFFPLASADKWSQSSKYNETGRTGVGKETSAHAGIDLQTYSKPIAVYAAFDMVVAKAGNFSDGFGTHALYVTSADNTVNAIYGHMSSLDPAVVTGATIKKGTLLGETGDEGDSYGVHLHYELYSNDEKLHETGDLKHNGRYTFDPLGKHVSYNIPTSTIKSHK